MSEYTTILFEKQSTVGIIWLNRPEIHNAFNATMLKEIIHCVKEVNKMDDIRVLVFKGKGKSFCAGADLNWMRDVASYSYEENYKESLMVSECFYTIYSCKKPTIALVHGAAIGGANGFIAPCDFAVAEENTKFSFSEVKIGIVPACISPYVYKRTGEFATKELMLSGRRINGKEAEQFRLVNKSVSESEMNAFFEGLSKELHSSGPDAIHSCKLLLEDISNNYSFDDCIDYTAKKIAERRESEEGQEGMASFLEKRKTKWNSN